MAGLLIASSPVEIESLADEAGLDAAAREAALALFHRLTSELELDAIAVEQPGHEDWPRHRFFFGETTGPIGPLQDRLETMPGLVDAGNAVERPENGVPPILFVQGHEGAYSGVLLAGHDADWINRVSGPLEDASKQA